EEELQSIVQRLHTLDLPFLVIGHGSNLLVDDFPGVFISLKKMESIFTAEQRRVTASSELPMATFIRKVATLGWGGCESLAGIPGSLGGAIYMNAGAHYQSVFDYLVSLKFLDHSGVIRVLPRDQIDFSYRRGFRDGIILSAQFSFLKKESTEILLGKIRDKMQWRREKQPRGPNGGCMFKNLANHFAGALVEQVGLKGTSIGGAKIAEQHGNFIVNNDGNATVSDIKRLLRLMRQRVFERYGIFLEREILFASDRC
ncbi:MAG: UDP-N-acetylmuramate dehydrogenase, partial [Puniceicoccales bacterium]|nr:UDP-N-acetylmuramate dehydrogenase [Puniceicoccales bacterium]